MIHSTHAHTHTKVFLKEGMQCIEELSIELSTEILKNPSVLLLSMNWFWPESWILVKSSNTTSEEDDCAFVMSRAEHQDSL